MPLAEWLAQHAAGDLRKPVVDRAKERENRASDQYVMEVRDDKESVVHLPVERDSGQHQARQAADQEDEEEAADPPHRSEEHTSELQSRGLISYAVFCLIQI